MTLSTLLVCADAAVVDVLRRVLEELGIKVELCAEPARAAVRLAQERFNLIVLDCKTQKETIGLLLGSRSSRLNDSTLAVVVVEGQESIRELFSLGVNFVVYKPVAYERALSSLRAAQTLLYRDKRRKVRAMVHTQATVDYAGGEQVRATLVDLAEDGMAVNFGKKLPPTSKVYFQFQLPGQKTTVRLSGQVVWQDWNGHACGECGAFHPAECHRGSGRARGKAGREGARKGSGGSLAVRARQSPRTNSICLPSRSRSIPGGKLSAKLLSSERSEPWGMLFGNAACVRAGVGG